MGSEAPRFGPASPAGLGAGNRAARSWASRARRASAGKFLGVQPSRSGGFRAGDAHLLPRPQHRLSGRVRCASCNPSRAGFGARGPRPGGAGGFFAERSLSLRGAKIERRDSAPGSPSGRTAPRTPKRTGAESWVFAGKMRVSVQLAYKVPVLGPQDRHFLHAPRRPKPAPSWSSCAPAGPPPPMSTRVEGLGRRAPRGVSAVWGKSVLRQRNSNALESVSRQPPGRAGTLLGVIWGRGRKGFFLLDPPALLYGANLEFGGGEDRA